ncbi:hypothetical protein LG3211_5374 [Lysobacter gummosus]|nr:hypothetical protein LG3211_5374 [Lysobacter gummosus]
MIPARRRACAHGGAATAPRIHSGPAAILAATERVVCPPRYFSSPPRSPH